jgi:hypothetical protein
MKLRLRRYALAMVTVALASMTIPNAFAQCGVPGKLVKPANWTGSHTSSARLLLAAFGKHDDDEGEGPSIVGMWHVVFTARTQNRFPIKDLVTDNAVAVWHKDGTEVMNSNRPAQDGNFCLGIWEKTGKFNHHLNHISWAGNDPANAPGGIGNPSAGAQIIENVTLHPDGDHFSGTYTLTAYTANGQPAVTFTGVIAATRITVNTPITSLF